MARALASEIRKALAHSTYSAEEKPQLAATG
jgi:hypothetical protein